MPKFTMRAGPKITPSGGARMPHDHGDTSVAGCVSPAQRQLMILHIIFPFDVKGRLIEGGQVIGHLERIED